MHIQTERIEVKMKTTLKKAAALAAAAMLALSMASCGNTSENTNTTAGASDAAKTTVQASSFDVASEIAVVTREEGSGTRGAFIELFGIEEKDENGEKVDKTIDTADTTQSTGVMLTTVAGNESAIGYVSLGALNDTVKALKIDGAEPTVENVKNDTYKIKRPFNIVTKDGLSEVAQDFVDYILSADGQKIVEDNGYIASVDGAKAYEGKKPSGKISITGSSSVTPVMEKLQEAYLKVNTNAKIEINMSDSSTGIKSAAGGSCDIGMASRELKDSEKTDGVKSTVIAIDGIAVIVNSANTADDLTSAAVKDIYTGNATVWSDIIK